MAKAANDTSVINVRMRQETVDQIDELQRLLNAPSRSDAIRRAIELSDVLAIKLKNGAQLIISEDGKKQEVLIPGLTK